MNFKSIFLTCFIFLTLSISAFGEYYQYTDKNGVMHFTDNILEVPEKQRKKLNVHQSVISSEETVQETVEMPKNEASKEPLAVQRVELVKEYNSLLKKKEELDKQSKDLRNKKYNELALQLNNEIFDYQKKCDEYERLASQYNAQVSAKKSPSSEEQK